MLDEIGESARFSKVVGMASKGLSVFGIGIQFYEAYQYSKLIDEVKAWGENYQKNYNAQLDEAMAALRGASEGDVKPIDVKPVVVTIPLKPKRSRADETREALERLARQLAYARQRASVAPVPEPSETNNSSGGYSGDACELVPNPFFSPIGIPFGEQPPFIPSCMLPR